MIYTDYHVHSTLSHDGISTMNEHIEKAISQGLKELCFTEHYDIYDGVKSNLKTIDVENYNNEFLKLKEVYKDKINLKFGIEIGLQPDIEEIIKGMVKKYDFDFVIGSSHITCKKDISKDISFFEGISRHQAYMKYFNEVLKNITIYDEFDVYGHIDYIVRYGGYEDKTLEYDEFSDILDEILKLIIKKDKGIEVNTSGIRYGLNTPHPNVDIIKRYKELGGSIITIGSDAHRCEDLCSNFEDVKDMLKDLGFTYYTIFDKRKPIFIDL